MKRNLADEPSGNLVSAKGEELLNPLIRPSTSGTTIIIITHNLRDAGCAQRTTKLLNLKVMAGDVPASALL